MDDTHRAHPKEGQRPTWKLGKWTLRRRRRRWSRGCCRSLLAADLGFSTGRPRREDLGCHFDWFVSFYMIEFGEDETNWCYKTLWFEGRKEGKV